MRTANRNNNNNRDLHRDLQNLFERPLVPPWVKSNQGEVDLGYFGGGFRNLAMDPDPSASVHGQVYYNTVDQKLKAFIDYSWQHIANVTGDGNTLVETVASRVITRDTEPDSSASVPGEIYYNTSFQRFRVFKSDASWHTVLTSDETDLANIPLSKFHDDITDNSDSSVTGNQLRAFDVDPTPPSVIVPNTIDVYYNTLADEIRVFDLPSNSWVPVSGTVTGSFGKISRLISPLVHRNPEGSTGHSLTGIETYAEFCLKIGDNEKLLIIKKAGSNNLDRVVASFG